MQLELMPANWFVLALKGFAIGFALNWNQALVLLKKANELSNGSPLAQSYLAYCYGMLGNKTEARSCVLYIESFHSLHPELLKYEDLALAWWGIGDRDKEFDYIYKAIGKKEGMICYMNNSPVYIGIQQDIRFAEVKRKMNI